MGSSTAPAPAPAPAAATDGESAAAAAAVTAMATADAGLDAAPQPPQISSVAQPAGPRNGEDTLTVWQRLVAGGLAGAVSKTVIAPGDRVKILYQVNRDRRFSIRSAVKTFRKIVEHRGLRGLWAGNSAQLVRIVPYAAIGYLSFDWYQSLLMNGRLLAPLFHGSGRGGGDSAPAGDSEKITARFVAGAAAGATATAATYPLDLLRSRMANQWLNYDVYPTVMKAARKIYAEEGARALVHGMRPTLLGIVPYAGLSFMTFETLKSRIRRRRDDDDEREEEEEEDKEEAEKARGPEKEHMGRLPHVTVEDDIPIGLRLLAGGVAGLVAQSATYPLDIVRRRMQVGIPYEGIAHAFREIVRHEGFVHGMYKGLLMNWFKGPVAVSVSFVTNDLVKNFFTRRRREQQEQLMQGRPQP